jgi:hypothetical protein
MIILSSPCGEASKRRPAGCGQPEPGGLLPGEVSLMSESRAGNSRRRACGFPAHRGAGPAAGAAAVKGLLAQTWQIQLSSPRQGSVRVLDGSTLIAEGTLLAGSLAMEVPARSRTGRLAPGSRVARCDAPGPAI